MFGFTALKSTTYCSYFLYFSVKFNTMHFSYNMNIFLLNLPDSFFRIKSYSQFRISREWILILFGFPPPPPPSEVLNQSG